MAYRYKTVKRGGKTVLLHRWLMERKLGRPLLPTEHVHHINEDPHDNRIDNLKLIDPGDHQRHHHPAIHPITKTCATCGERFTPHKTKRARNKTCGHRCGLALAFRIRYRWTLAEARTWATNGSAA
jgi:hypothetical protein